jgi:DNA-binding NarL/FixJ family response regulator
VEYYTVIVLDGHKSAAYITKRGLEWALGAAANIQVVEKPLQAWQACATGKVDLLIVDPSEYGEEAWELLELVQKTYPSTKLLILAANNSPLARRRASHLQIKYFPKTEELSEICNSVRSLLRIIPKAEATPSSQSQASCLH